MATPAAALVGPGGSDFGRDPGRRDNGGSQPGGGISIGSDNGKNYDGTNGFKGPLQPAGSRYRDKNGVWRYNEPAGNQKARDEAGTKDTSGLSTSDNKSSYGNAGRLQ